MPIATLAVLLASTPAPTPANVLEPTPHLKAVYARQDGLDTGEFIEFRDIFPGAPGPIVAAIDGDGVLVALWDFSHVTLPDWGFLIGGPAVPNRDGDLSAGVGPAINGTSDFIPDGTVTIRAWHGGDAAHANFLAALVGLNIDPDGDGTTLLEDSGAPTSSPLGSMALVDGTWPETSTAFDCAPIVGPNGMDAPAGAVGQFPAGPCLDRWLLADGSNVTPGLSHLASCFDGAYGAVVCGEGIFGTPYCEGAGTPFVGQTLAWGSPLLADQNLNVGASGTAVWQLHLVSAGRGTASLPGVNEQLCLAAPYFRVPGTLDWQGTRTEVNFGSLSANVPVFVGDALCFQTWHRTNTTAPSLSQPIAVLLR